MEVDPYASILDESSQEKILKHCFFARETQEGLTPFSTNESSLSLDEFPVASTGIMVCSLPDGSSFGEEEEVTPQPVEIGPRRMDDDDGDGGAVDVVDAASHDQLGTVDLGKDNNASIVFSEEKSLLGNGFVTPRTVPVDDISGSELNGTEVSKRKSPMQEDLGFLESKSEGLGESTGEDGIGVEKELNLNVEELCEDKTLETQVEKSLGCESPCNSVSTPSKSQKIAKSQSITNGIVDNVDISREIELKSSSGHSKGDIPVFDRPVILEPSKDVVMKDLPVIGIDKDIENDASTDKVPEVDNPQAVDGKQDDNDKGKLDKSEHADSSDLSPEVTSVKPPGLRKLPNWVVGGANNEMEDSNQSGNNRRGTKGKDLDTGGRSRVGETENLLHGRVRLVEDGSDHGREGVGKVEDSSKLPNSIKEGSYIAMEDFNQCGNYRRAMKANKLNMDGRKREGEAMDLGHGGVRLVEEDSNHGGKRVGEVEDSSRQPNWVEGSDNATEDPMQHGNDKRATKVVKLDVGRKKRVGEAEDLGQGSDHGGKKVREVEGSSIVAEASPSGNQSPAVTEIMDSSFFKANHSRGNADNSKEIYQETMSLLEIVRRKGLKIPRPSWWRPEGYSKKY